MPTIGFNVSKGYMEHSCDICGEVIPWSESNIFGECKDCSSEVDGTESKEDAE